MNGVARQTGVSFRVRLQMYPRAEQLLVILLLLVALPLFSVGEGAAVGAFTAVSAGLAMWLAVPALARYRAFGVPLRLWVVDAVIAVHVVVCLFLAVWFATGDGVWKLAGILLADAAVMLRLVVSTRPVLRGDRVGGGGSRRVPSRQLQCVPATSAWRLIYVPVGLVAVLVAGVIVLLTWVTERWDDSFTVTGPALVVAAAAAPGILVVFSNGYVGWTALGLPVSGWLIRAHLCAVGFTGTVALSWLLSVKVTGLDSGLHSTTAPGMRVVLVGVGLVAAAVLIVRGSLAGNGGAVGLVFVALFGIANLASSALAENMQRALPALVIVLVVIALVAWKSIRRARRGHSLHRPGPFTKTDRTYYQREGAL